LHTGDTSATALWTVPSIGKPAIDAGHPPRSNQNLESTRLKDTIVHFMWGYQQHFRSGVQRGTARALASIGLPVDVQAVLVGFAVGHNAQHPICIEPEDGPLKSRHLANVLSRASQLAHAAPESRVFYGHPAIGQKRHELLTRASRALALVEAIEGSGVFGDMTFFASNATTVGDYEVHACVGIEASALNSVPSLDDDVVDRVRVGRSLQHEVIVECLHRADVAMHLPDAGADLYPLGRYVDDLVKTAAARLASGAAFRVTGMPADLFEAVTSLSSLGYERADAEGRLIVTKTRIAVSNSRVAFRLPIAIQKPRIMRKLLELTDPSVALLVDHESAYGLGAVPPNTPAVEICVRGRATWHLNIENKCLMRVAYGRAGLPTPHIQFAQFTDTAIRIVGSVDVERVWAIVLAVQESGRGTTVVVSKNPCAEAARLSGQTVEIEPTDLTPEEIVRLTKIDGAVILGPDGRCYAFGAILDGEASGRGDPARGSRFNSAVRYHSSASPSSLLVVVSDDGTVDLIPSLRPRVTRDEVEAAVKAFCDLCNTPPLDGEQFARAHDRVLALEFYLNPSQCKRASEAYSHEMQRRFKENGIAITRPPLQPHPDMNDSYFA
jgi:hypothetical protein